ncbi:GNAT family N-acetyltransferase [Streptomyces sannanensis]|uniref:GNAT family N-acetyltransferase n=1 Tax=Streptomyces sannanensis TaxID=285536 RepID=A0ABP6SNB1_9ACTN
MVRVREMTEADIEAVSAVRVRGWQFAYAGIVPQTYLDGMTIEDDARARRARFTDSHERVLNLVAVDGDEGVVGWAALGPYRGNSAEPDAGELYAIYLRPDVIGSGAGRTLIEAVHAEAVSRRFRTLLLWVLRDNARARRFYASAGYAPDGTVRGDRYEDVELPALRYRVSLGQDDPI